MIPETGSIKTELTYPVWGQNRNQIVNSDYLLRIADNHRDAYPENLPVFYPMQNTNFQPEFDSYQRDDCRTTVPVHLGAPGYSVP